MKAPHAALVIVTLAAGLALTARCDAGTEPAAPAAPSPAPAPSASAAPASPYQRLGGYDALASLTDDFIGRLFRDPSLSRFFAGYSDDARGRIRQLLLDQLCAASGGPCLYIGRDMKTAHRGLGIHEAEWAATVGHLIASLDKLKLAQPEKDEVLVIVARLKRDIVEKP